ncbi:serine--tRNA ligase [Desulfovibrio inopinatus]|uniref:serine--tRNA ligase n=1 Tax=Desulfovibrio inopinatus TaxID=102109 RepID=UPI00041E06D2|nr:serine--tRNA ligase [Desulfovibrio inopinatus]
MLDVKFVRNNIEAVKDALARRGGAGVNMDEFAQIDAKRRALLTEVETLKSERNAASAEVAKKKRAKEDASDIIASMGDLSARIKALDEELKGVDEAVSQLLMAIPNMPHASVPDGTDENDNPVVRVVGEIPEAQDDAPNHWEVGERLAGLDFERAAKITGSRFCVSRGWAAAMERALANFMLDMQTVEHGYTEVLPPAIVNSDSLYGTGQLPKFAEDLFRLDFKDFYLIPTAEVPLTNLHRDETLDEADLPITYCAHTPCFRSEAGSYGKDTRGLIRQHQFNKVELVRFVHPDTSYDELERLTGHAEAILQRLDLPYRVVALCAGDIGFSAAKTYDLEVYLPGQKKYREISSCSNFEDFQARRAGIRFRPSGSKKTSLVHTLNGSGLAVGRTLVAVIENYVQKDGSLVIPEVLRPYMHGREVIEPQG